MGHEVRKHLKFTSLPIFLAWGDKKEFPRGKKFSVIW